jgi:alanyl-tRNA synthetase
MDKARDKAPESAILFVSVIDGGVVVIGGLGSTLKKSSDLHMGRFVGQVCDAFDGRGGGRPDFAQGGGKNTDILDAVIAQIPDWFKTAAS